MVTRDNPGSTALERTIIRWNFDSSPQGARVYWRVVSSIPDIVKNTNELYLAPTPYEETRSFNILGLTYENSRDVIIEVKVKKAGYMDQVKRFNVRQAIDQQEISSFFELVKTMFLNKLKSVYQMKPLIENIQKWIGLIVVSVIIAISCSCASILSGRKQNVKISSYPSGARIYVDGRDQGAITPSTVKLPRKKE